MLEDGLSSGQGATYFLISLLDHPDFDPERHVPLMRTIGLGGSAVPGAVGERAEALGIATTRSFGSTEHPSISGSTAESPRDKRLYTDGTPLAGVEVRIVDENGADVDRGEPGEIWSRGPDCFVGYTDPALTVAAFTNDGWYRTGDIGVLDDDGYLAITDRKKDIIIRGGENVSAVEVEEQLLRMPGVAEVAVVAEPDPRSASAAARSCACNPAPRCPTSARYERTWKPGASPAPSGPKHVRDDHRVPAHRKRQDPEVRAPSATSRRGSRAVSATAAPLSDVCVVDVSRFVSGPLATFFLASMGAEVLAVESPVASASRRMPPLADRAVARATTTPAVPSLCPSSSAHAASAASRSTSAAPKGKTSFAGSSPEPTCSSRTRDPVRCATSGSATTSFARGIRA